MTPISDIAHWLQSRGYGHWDDGQPCTIFGYLLYPDPHNQIMIKPRGGGQPDEVMGGEAVDYPSVDIHIRNEDLATAESIAESIRLTLDGQEVNGASFWDSRSCSQFMEKDENDWYRFMISFDVIKER
jgi:hypothetical protein